MITGDAYFTLFSSIKHSLDASSEQSPINSQYRLSLEQASLCDTLQGLLPSRTLACIMPSCCNETAINCFVRILAIYQSTNQSTDSGFHFLKPTAKRFAKSLPDAIRSEFENIRDYDMIHSFFHIVDLLHPPLMISQMPWAAVEILNERTGNNFVCFNATHESNQGIRLLPAHSVDGICRNVAQNVSNDNHTFTIISKSGHRHVWPLQLAMLSPVIRNRAAKRDVQFTLKDCDSCTIELVKDFLQLLSVEPFVVFTNNVTAGTPFSAVIPVSYTTVLAPFTQVKSQLQKQLRSASEMLQLAPLNTLIRMQKRWLQAHNPSTDSCVNIETVPCQGP